MSSALPDATTPFGQQVARRLREEPAGRLAHDRRSRRTPQPNPVWFFWDGEKLLVYNQPNARRLVNIRRNPHVAFHLNSSDEGEDVVVITGVAEISEDEKPANEVPGYVEKYRQRVVETDSGDV